MKIHTLLMLLALVGCGARPVTGDEANIMSPDEVPAFVARANSGDLAAANTLAVYYDGLGEAIESRRWLMFAAERGDCNAINVLYDDATVPGGVDEAPVRSLRSWATEHNCELSDS